MISVLKNGTSDNQIENLFSWLRSQRLDVKADALQRNRLTDKRIIGEKL